MALVYDTIHRPSAHHWYFNVTLNLFLCLNLFQCSLLAIKVKWDHLLKNIKRVF